MKSNIKYFYSTCGNIPGWCSKNDSKCEERSRIFCEFLLKIHPRHKLSFEEYLKESNELRKMRLS